MRQNLGDAELLRIAQESLRNREESEEKLRGERERIARTQDELKTRFRAQVGIENTILFYFERQQLSTNYLLYRGLG